MKSGCLVYVKREWLLAVRDGATLAQPLLFLLLLVVLFPLAVGSDPKMLNAIAAGVIWLAVMLALLLASDKSLKSDYANGSLAQFVLSQRGLWPLIMAKCLVQWVVLIVPMVLALPLLALFYQLSTMHVMLMAATVLLGAPTLLLLSMLGAALTLPVSRGGLLLLLMILPMYVPVLIFAVWAVNAAAQGFSAAGQLAILAALLLLSVVSLPFAIVAAIKLALTQQ